MTTFVLRILILVTLYTQGYCRIFEINTPDDLKYCFEQKRLKSNASDPHWDNAHAYCIQKNNWHLLRTAWPNISEETGSWVDELLRMSEYEIEGSRHRRQATIRRGRPVQLRRRKEYRRLTDTERQNFHRAVILLKRDRVSTYKRKIINYHGERKILMDEVLLTVGCPIYPPFYIDSQISVRRKFKKIDQLIFRNAKELYFNEKFPIL